MSKNIMSRQCDLFLCENCRSLIGNGTPWLSSEGAYVGLLGENTEPEKQRSSEIKKIFLFCLKIDEQSRRTEQKS